MRPLRTIALTALCLLAPAAALAPGAAGTGLPGNLLPAASLTGFACQKALDPAARAVSITSVMGPLSGATHLAVEFVLLERKTGSASYASLAGPKLGVWIELHDAGFGTHDTDTWRVVHPVADLGAPADYRFQVRFRWTDAKGHVLVRLTRLSHVCFQPELRPDLAVRSITVTAVPNDPSLDEYVALIRNLGSTAAGPFTVRLSDAGTTREVTVGHIDAHGRRTVSLTGPACQPLEPPVVTADPDGQVDVYSRAQASFAATCPAESGGSS